MEHKAMPLARPLFSQAEAQAVAEVLASGWVTQGPRVAAFEAAFARYTGAPHACAVSNCTTALHLALHAVGARAGDVVVTVSMSFIATANAIRHCGAEPVFVDIDPATLNMSPDNLNRCLMTDFERRQGALWYRHVERLCQAPSPLRRAAGPVGRLAAVLVVHQVGMPCDMAEILLLARSCGLPVVEDAACAIGSEMSLDGGTSWQRIGWPLGDVACFSFHPRKVITTGDGGMLTTARADLDRSFRLLRQHGMSVSDAARHNARQVVLEEYTVTGFNYRLTDVQAAIGLAQLDKLPDIVNERRHLAALYHQHLDGIPGICLPTEPAWARSNWQSFQIQLDRPEWQRPVMEALLQRGITTRRGVMCAHREAPYRAAWPEGCLPASEAASQSGVIVPLFPGMTEADVERVALALASAVKPDNGAMARAAA
jgi:dTDP-4-amino-4,6-dideoxygalactose transaminase